MMPKGASMPETHASFVVEIICQGCLRSGSIAWEEQAGAERRLGSARILVGISEGFNQRPGRNESGDPTIACAYCGTAQKDQPPSP
jgi:hypothetical protein